MSFEVDIFHRQGRFVLEAQFRAPKGLTVLFGRSGSGKTTLINAVSGLLRPQSGFVKVGDRVLFDSRARIALPARKRRLGYIFQDARLFPHLSVRQNLLYGQWFATRRPNRDSLEHIVDLLGLEDVMHQRTRQLSGGEQQRVAIGRALLASPDLILADEPLAALDAPRKAEIMPYFERMRDELGIPILYVSHSAAEVARLATTVVVLEHGKVTQVGPALDVLADPNVAPTGVRGVGAVISARLVRQHDDGLSELDAGGVSVFVPRVRHPEGAVMRLRIAAHEVILSRNKPEGLSALNIFPGRVEAVRTGDGPGALVTLSTPAGPILARVTRRSAHSLALTVGVQAFAIVKSVAIAPEDIGGRS